MSSTITNTMTEEELGVSLEPPPMEQPLVEEEEEEESIVVHQHQQLEQQTHDNTNGDDVVTEQDVVVAAAAAAGDELCHVCGVGDDGRPLCHFLPNEDSPEAVYLHVFCGKTAGILPHVNRPDLEILTKAGVKNKHGTGVSVTLALQRCRSARVNDPSNREQEYYLSKEFERIYQQVTKEPAHTAAIAGGGGAGGADDLTGVGADGTGGAGGGVVDGTGDPSALPPAVPNPMYYDSNGGGITTTTEHHHHDATNPDAASASTITASSSDDHLLPAAKRLKPSSPYDLEMERLQQVCDQCRGVGYSLIRGVDGAADSDSFDPTTCSQIQVDHVRVIVITKDRQDRMEEMSKLILGEQHGQELITFASFAYQVINAWNAFTVRFHEAVDWQEKFDLLLGFTDTLKEHDVWMQDHEEGWGGEKMVRQLALSWKLVLQRTDEELGIDVEYTRPGIVALLEHFQEAVESVETTNPSEKMVFDFLSA